MKRIIALTIALFLAAGLRAQTDNDTMVAFVGDGMAHQKPEFKMQLGLSVGQIVFNNGNDDSPYYSHHGQFLQIPLLASWKLSPNWKISTGLRYDFYNQPLYYTVEPVSTSLEGLSEHGLQFSQTAAAMTQKAYAFHSYVGIPVELKWYPWASQSNSLAFSVDFFAGFAVSQYFDITNITHKTDGSFSYDGYNRDTFNAMNRWKMELGLTFSTNYIGLVHGLRFFVNLLPTYIDPDTGSKIYLSGFSFFL